MRDFCTRGCRNQHRDYVGDVHVDLGCLQETIKSTFSLITGLFCFVCRWFPTSGHSSDWG